MTQIAEIIKIFEKIIETSLDYINILIKEFKFSLYFVFFSLFFKYYFKNV